MYEGNPGEINFGLSLHEVRVIEGSSYRESNVWSFLGDMREARASTSACLARIELHGSVLKSFRN